MKFKNVASQISEGLALKSPPIAIATVTSPPAGIQSFSENVPSACTLWRRAETQVFYAAAEAHYNCPVGAMTMGFDLPENVKSELMALATKMCEVNYLLPTEPAAIPTLKGEKSGIVYGPLQDFPIEPDVVLMWLKPSQAMIYNEAAGHVRWTATSPMSAFGRPACAALAVAKGEGQATCSLGCAGMRTFTEVADDEMLAVLPGSRLAEFHQSLLTIVEANRTMSAFYKERKSSFV